MFRPFFRPQVEGCRREVSGRRRTREGSKTGTNPGEVGRLKPSDVREDVDTGGARDFPRKTHSGVGVSVTRPGSRVYSGCTVSRSIQCLV